MITEINKKITEIKARDPLTERIIASAYRIHRDLGPGFNEKIYQNALKIAFEKEGLRHETEKKYSVVYQNRLIGTLIVDLVVEDRIIVEVKAVTGIMPKVFEAQVLSYLKIADIDVGLLINFGNRSCQVRRLMT